MRLLVTRPIGEAEPLAALLREAGHEPVIGPVMEIRPVAGARVDLDGVVALLVTSRNGVRALAAATARRELPVLAVGDSSAEAARAAGFTRVGSAGGDVEALAALVKRSLRPEAGALLHVAGSAAAGDLAALLAGYRIQRAVLYEARPRLRLVPESRHFLEAREPGGVLLYSPRSAMLFAGQVEAEGLSAAVTPLTAFCLSAAVAGTARRLPFGRVLVAPRPEQAALLALIPQDDPA